MIFNETEHSYVRGEDKYCSVTTLYAMFKRPKDWQAIAEAYAMKHGETAEHWLKVWEDNKNEAANFGSKYHLIREHGEIKAPDEIKIGKDLSDLPDGEYKELIVWSEYFRVAGQVDNVLIKDGVVNIRDYKTCKSIDTDPKMFYVKGRGKVAENYLPPLSHLKVFNLQDFTLQLSLYAYILEMYGYDIGDLTVEHIEFTGREKGYSSMLSALEDNKLKETRTDYPVPYLRTEAKAMLTHFKNQSKW